jgi:chromosome segregation ATPase
MIFKLNNPHILYDADAGGGGGGQDGGNDGGNAGSNNEQKLSFTQAELDAKFADRAKRAAESAINEILTKAGLKTVDELTAALAEGKKLKDSQLTDLQKAQADLKAANDKLAQAEAEKNTALAQATERLMKAAILAEAVAQGFRPEAVNDVWLIVDRSKIKEKDGVFEGVKDAVGQVVKDKPFWLKADDKTPHGTPPGPGPKKPGTETPPEPQRIRF